MNVTITRSHYDAEKNSDVYIVEIDNGTNSSFHCIATNDITALIESYEALGATVD